MTYSGQVFWTDLGSDSSYLMTKSMGGGGLIVVQRLTLSPHSKSVLSSVPGQGVSGSLWLPPTVQRPTKVAYECDREQFSKDRMYGQEEESTSVGLLYSKTWNSHFNLGSHTANRNI